MAQTIKLKRSATQNAVPSTSSLALGEIALNTYDGKLFIKKDVGGTESIVTIGAVGAGSIGPSELASTAVTAGSYGSTSAIPVITVDADGRITSASTATISGLSANSVTSTEIAANAVGISELNVSDGTDGQVLTTDGSGTLTFETPTGGAASANAFATNTASGNGSTATFTLSSTPSAESKIIAFINGVFQNQDAYTISGTDITFDTAPISGTNNVVIYVIGDVYSGESVLISNFDGNGSTTAFTLSNNPGNENNTQVYIDGVYQQKTTYSVSGTTLTFSSAPPTGTANIEVVMLTSTTVNTPAAGSVVTASMADDSVTGAKLVSSAVTTAKIADANVTTAKIADANVTTAKIANDAVTLDKIADAVFVTESEGISSNDNDTTLPTSAAVKDYVDGKDFETGLAGDSGTGTVNTSQTLTVSGTANEVNTSVSGQTVTVGLPDSVSLTSNLTVGGYIAGPASFTIDPAGVGNNTGTVVIAGNLQVDGTQTIINSTSMSVDDLNLTLASGAANAAAANGAGLTIDGASATLLYASSGDKFVFNKTVDATIGTAAQPNITSVGTLTGLTTTGNLVIGTEDNNAAIIEISGGATGSAEGGEIRLDTAADYDSTYEFYRLDVSQDDFRIGRQGQTDFTLFSDGTAQFFGNLTATLSTSAQPNITSVGTLTGFTSTGIDDNADATAITIDSNENIGIGTSIFTNSYKTYIEGLDQDTANLTDSGNHGATLYLRATANAAGSGGAVAFGTTFGNKTPFAAIKGHVLDGSTNTVGDLCFSTRASVSATALTERLRIDSSGKVGIGTDSPSKTLHVNGEVQIENNLTLNENTPAIVIPNGDLRLFTGGTESMRIDSSGTVLFKSGAFPTNQDSPFIYRIGGGSLAIGAATETGTGAYAAFYTNSLERMRILSDGNVQIGTSNPSGNKGITIQAGTNSSASLRLKNDAHDWDLNCQTNDKFAIYSHTAGTERLVIDTSGKVGIGTDSPVTQLDVRGVVHVGASASTTPVISRSLAPTGSQGLFLTAGVVNGESITTPTFADNSSSGASIYLGGNAVDQYGGSVVLKAYGAGADGNQIVFENRSGANTFKQTMRIHSDGNVTKPTQCNFLARRSGNQTGYNASGSYGDGVRYNSEIYDIGGDFNVTTGIFTAPVDGTYLIQGSVYSGTAGTNWSQAWLAVNGARADYTDMMGNDGDLFISTTHIVKLSAGDEVRYHPYYSGSTSVTILANNNHTWFKGYLLG